MRVPPQYKGKFSKVASHKNDPEYQSFSWFEVPKAVWHFLDADRSKFLAFNFILFAVFFYELVPTFIMGKVVDFFTSYRPGSPIVLFYAYVAALAISYAIVALIRLHSKNMISRIGIAIRSRAKVMGFERLMDASVEWHAEENTGNKVQRIMTGSQALYDAIKLGSNNIYQIIVNFIGVTLFFLFTNWRFFLFLLVYNAGYFFIQSSFNRKVEELSTAYDKALEASSGAYIEGTSNILSIKAVGAEKHLHSIMKDSENTARDFQIELTDTNNRKWKFFQMWNGCAYAIFVTLIGMQVLAGNISIGLILVLYTYFTKLRESVNDTNDLSTAFIGFKADIARFMPLFRKSSAIRFGDEDFPKEWDAIRIRGADFDYPNGQPGLVDVDLQIKRGERMGVAGLSGGGKSTLVKVLLGLYELKKGEFLIGKTDFYDISHEQIMQNVAVVLQETELLNLSLEDNITMMRELDRDLLERAIEIADLKEMISRLPDGIKSMVGERGYALSGGERQRVGIARAIYKDAPILLLDEATSALDSQTEKNIIDRLFGSVGKDKTFLIVAHRLSTLRNADRVIVMKRGSVAESGSFKDLIKKKTTELSKLYALQS